MVQAPSPYPEGVSIAISYARDVLSGNIAACRLVHLTCKRFLSELEQAERGRSSWEFWADLAERSMIFAGLRVCPESLAGIAEPSQHEPDRGKADEGNRSSGEVLEIFCQPTTAP